MIITPAIAFRFLTAKETASAALAYINEKLGQRPVVAVVYSHSHGDHYGGVRGVVDDADVKSGKVPVIAPVGFMEHAIAENVYAGNAMSRRMFFQYGILLPRSPFGHVDQYIGKNTAAGNIGLIEPTRYIVKDFEELTIDGQCKSENFLLKCITQQVRLIVIDSIGELLSVIKIQKLHPKNVNFLLRVNPDFIPKGMSKSSATGSRHSSFGMNGEEILKALSIIKNYSNLIFKGIHFHIGTGIRHPEAFSKVIKKSYPLFGKIKSFGYEIEIIDVGGGFASMTTRELSSLEMLASQALSSYQLKFGRQKFYSFEDYLNEIRKARQIRVHAAHAGHPVAGDGTSTATGPSTTSSRTTA